MMKFLRTLLLALPLTATTLARELPAPLPPTAAADSLAEDTELLERLHNMPNIEIGKGITFQPKNKWMELTLRFRMQNLIGLTFDPNFSLTATEARVKRVRLRFDGYLYSPKIVYSIQLGFSGHDTGKSKDGGSNIVRDAIVYYVPSPAWNIGFGQTKIKANRAHINSSGALQLIDRSIVNGEFNPDRDFGLFGEYNKSHNQGFSLSFKGSITLGEGRNTAKSHNGGLSYTGRLELYPTGRFSAKGEVIEGDYLHEKEVKILIAGAYSFNHKAQKTHGQRGDALPQSRNMGTYYADFVLKYRGLAFCADFMGRTCRRPIFENDSQIWIYRGCGLNVQTSYLVAPAWEIALRNATLFPSHEIRPLAGYAKRNQTTIGVTRYIIGHSLKVQADVSYNAYKERNPTIIADKFDRWHMRLQLELGL